MTWSEKIKLARNPSTPGEVLLELAKDEDSLIRARVASHLNTFENTLLYLATDINNGVRHKVTLNPKSSSKVIVTLFEAEKNLTNPSILVIEDLYYNNKLPYIAKIIIETLFRDFI